MNTTQKMIAAVAIVAVLAVAAVGAGFAYTATTSNTGNSATSDLLVVSQKVEDTNMYLNPMVHKEVTFNTTTSWVAVADNPATTDVDESEQSREIVTATAINGIEEITGLSGYYELGSNEITVSNTDSTAPATALPNFIFKIDLGAKTAYNTGDDSGYAYYVAIVATNGTPTADDLIPVKYQAADDGHAYVEVFGNDYFTATDVTKKVVIVLQLEDEESGEGAPAGVQIDKTKDYSKIIDGNVTFTFTAEAGLLTVQSNVEVAVSGAPSAISITHPTITSETATYVSGDVDIATVAADGTVTGVAAGTTYVKITVTVDEVVYLGFAKVTVTN